MNQFEKIYAQVWKIWTSLFQKFKLVQKKIEPEVNLNYNYINYTLTS